MSLSVTASPAKPFRLDDGWLAVLATLALVALQASGGFAAIANSGGDNDSLLRLVEVRDLIAGQGWFDLHQYRMGVDGSLLMHWSRLVDAPIAALVLLCAKLTGNMASGETLALILWPALLLCASLNALLRAARCFAGGDAQVPALLIGATALYYTGVFMPGALDHHNVQLMLTLGTVALLLEAAARDDWRPGAAAGAASALSLAIAMEAAPYVAVAGLVVALWLLFQPERSWRTALGFGLAFGGLAAVLFAATVPPQGWFAAQCDAYSLPQLTAASLSGFGLAAVAASGVGRLGFAGRLAVFAGLGVVLAAVLMVFFPQCLADPYAGLDPRLKSWWLDGVLEAQPFWTILRGDPEMAAGHYATAAVALVWLGRRAVRNGLGKPVLLLIALLGIAFAVSVWQVRGSVFSLPFAAVPLAAMVAGWRHQVALRASTRAALAMVAAWLVSLNVVWSAAAGGLADLSRSATAEKAGAQISTATCEEAADFGALATMSPTGVLVVSNLGAPILRYTRHHVLAGPYHRNVAGNLAALDAFTGPVGRAEALARQAGIGLVALCSGNDETQFLAERAPNGLIAHLLRGETPAWLQPVPESAGRPLRLYAVVPRT